MGAHGIDMHRLQELVRLHRMGTRSREVARLLKISSTTERRYRRAIDEAGLLAGEVDELPNLERLKAVVKAAVRKPRAPQAVSKVEPWREQIKQLWERGAGPKVSQVGIFRSIFDVLLS